MNGIPVFDLHLTYGIFYRELCEWLDFYIVKFFKVQIEKGTVNCKPCEYLKIERLMPEKA